MVALHHPRNLAALTLALGVLISPPVINAAEPLGMYAGGAIGQARIDTGNLEGASPSGGVFSFGTYTEDHSAYKLIVGFRPLSLIGAEIAYMDFGHPGRSFSPGGTTSADVKMSGAAAFGMLYLPVPVVSVYAKAGLARLQATSKPRPGESRGDLDVLIRTRAPADQPAPEVSSSKTRALAGEPPGRAREHRVDETPPIRRAQTVDVHHARYGGAAA